MTRHAIGAGRDGRGSARTCRTVLAALALATSVGAGAASATSPPPAVPAAPTVDEIVAAHVEARGGAQKLRALQTMRFTGVVQLPGGRMAPVTREIARPGRIRMEVTYQGTVSVYAHDGETAWQVAPLQGQFAPQSLEGGTAAPHPDQLDIEGPLLGWREKGYQVSLVGKTRVGERDAWELAMVVRGGTVRHDFLDCQTYLTLRTDVERVIGSHKVPLQLSYGDYRPVDGIVYPFRIETRRRGGPPNMTLLVDTVEVNPPIDASRFRMPVLAAQPAAASSSHQVEMRGTVQAIDLATRQVTLKTAEGKPLPITAGPDVQRLGDLRVGDEVAVRYEETIAITPLPRDGSDPSMLTTQRRNDAQQLPGGQRTKQTTVVAQVMSIDLAASKVTLHVPERVDVTVQVEPVLARQLKVGDKVTAVFSEALAIGVSRKDR